MAKGSVKRRGKVWSFVVDLGPDPATGARRQARRSGFATEKEAESALRDLASSAAAGTAVARRRVTVAEFLAEWLETIRPRVRETTWVSYEMAVNRITRQIGAVQLQALTPLQVEGLYATLLEKGGSGGRALAPKTVRNCHIVLRRALADAERLGLVTRNPAASAEPVAAPRAEQREVDGDDWNAVLAQLRADGFSPVESIKVTRTVLHVSLGEAKEIVHTSEAWADAREGFDELHESGEQAANGL